MVSRLHLLNLLEAYPPLTDGAGSPVAPKAETPKPKKKKKPKPSKKGST